MLFSIVIPVYNVKKYLEECLESVLPQVEVCPYGAEVVLVDDGSTDGSGSICDEYKEKYGDFVKVIHKDNQGLLLARWSGICFAGGAYIVNCDSDDKLKNNMLDEMAEVIHKCEPDVIFFNMNSYDGKDERVYYKNIFTNDKICEISHQDVMKHYFLDNIPVVTSMASKAFKKSCLDLDHDYSSLCYVSMGEDTLLSAEIYARAEKFVYVNKNFYIYRSGSGMSARYDANYFDRFKKIELYIKQYNYIAENKTYTDWLDAKIINTIGRSVTQSGYCHMNYITRKKYIKDILEDELAILVLKRLSELKINLNKKYYWLLKMCKWNLYLIIHYILKSKNRKYFN